MNLFINSPAYYTQKYGIDNEIYRLCSAISQNIDIKQYTDCLDTIGIVPIIAPTQIINETNWKEERRISLPYRMASISLFSNYDIFHKADLAYKKELIVENILKSLYVIKKRLKGKFDYDRIENDIRILFIRMCS